MFNILIYSELLYYHIIYLLIIIFISFNIIASEFSSVILSEGRFPKAKLLSSGNYFIVYSKGFFIYNHDFSLNKSIYNFTNDDFIQVETDIEKTIIYELIKNRNSYILCLLKCSILFVMKNEKYINKYNISSDHDLCDFIVSGTKNLKIMYIFIYIEKDCEPNCNFVFNQFELDLILNNESNIYKNKTLELIHSNIIEFITCHKMNNFLESEEVLICFYSQIDSNEEYKIEAEIFDINNNYNKLKSNHQNIENIWYPSAFYDLKSFLLFDKKKNLVCYIIYDYNRAPEYNGECLLYDIENNIFDDTNFNFTDYQELEMYSFPETHQYVLVFYKEDRPIYKRRCETKYDREIMLIFLDKNLNHIEMGSNYEKIITLPECSKINSFSLVYSIIGEKYNIIYDCDNSTSGDLTINYLLLFFQQIIQIITYFF